MMCMVSLTSQVVYLESRTFPAVHQSLQVSQVISLGVISRILQFPFFLGSVRIVYIIINENKARALRLLGRQQRPKTQT